VIRIKGGIPAIVDEDVFVILSGIKWYETKDGYFRPSSWRTQGKKDIHRWVAWLKGEHITNKHVHHLNEKRNDNRWINLEISDMKKHASIHHKNKEGFKKESNPMYRKDVKNERIYGLLSRGFKVKDIANMLNVCNETIYRRIGRN
jgi:IS30 family transposase